MNPLWKEELTVARRRLLAHRCTCVLCKNGVFIESFDRGVTPLLQLLEEKRELTGFFAADRVVGRGAAFCYILMGVQAVWAGVISQSARGLLLQNNIPVLWDACVPAIRNRSGDGFCPIEQATLDVEDPQQALEVMQKLLHRS